MVVVIGVVVVVRCVVCVVAPFVRTHGTTFVCENVVVESVVCVNDPDEGEGVVVDD